MNLYESRKIMKDRNYFGCMLVESGEADAMISGLTRNYADAIRPAIHIIGTEEGVRKIAGMYLLLTKKGPLFLADTTVNIEPTAEQLAMIASACQVMGGPTSVDAASTVLIAGVGRIDAQAYRALRESGDAMCGVARTACEREWDGASCRGARALWSAQTVASR